MRRAIQALVVSLFVASLLCVEAMGQQARTYPAFTKVSRFTEYDSQGEKVNVSTSTSYHSSSGDWRSVSKSGDDEQATLYRRGVGVYRSVSRTSRIIKQMDHAPGCPLRTAEQLRADPKFVRTEDVLGFTAYVLLDRPSQDLRIEHYFVPELGGGTPVKQITAYKNGPKFVSEPISITLGEPNSIDITGPSYFVIEQVPVFVKNIGEHILSKPDPDYSPEVVAAGSSGVANLNVSVTVDEHGSVIAAGVPAGYGTRAMRIAAVDAAYKATFKPIIVDGMAVVATGMIPYHFSLSSASNGTLRNPSRTAQMETLPIACSRFRFAAGNT